MYVNLFIVQSRFAAKFFWKFLRVLSAHHVIFITELVLYDQNFSFLWSKFIFIENEKGMEEFKKYFF